MGRVLTFFQEEQLYFFSPPTHVYFFSTGFGRYVSDINNEFMVDEDDMTSDRQRIKSVMYHKKILTSGDENYVEVVPAFHGRKFDTIEKEEILEVVGCCENALEFAPENLHQDKEFILSVVKKENLFEH